MRKECLTCLHSVMNNDRTCERCSNFELYQAISDETQARLARFYAGEIQKQAAEMNDLRGMLY